MQPGGLMVKATFVHIWTELDQENLQRMMRWMRWHCPPDKGFYIRALVGGLRPSTLLHCPGGSPQYYIFTSEQETV